MPNPNGETRSLARQTALLAALNSGWETAESLIIAVGVYPDNEDSARRMLRADMDALRSLGFEIERHPDWRDPHYRIVGHARFGQERETGQ